jgi:hypothetical protein
LEPLSFKPRHEVTTQRCLAAKEMRAARDVEQEPIRRIEPHQRGITIAPVGDCGERAPVGLRVGIGNSDAREHRARIGERQAGVQSEAGRRIVDGRKPQRAFDRLDNDQRRVVRKPASAGVRRG